MEANGLPSPCSHPNSAPQGTRDWKEQEACMHAKSIQLCLTLCDPMDCRPPGSSVHSIAAAAAKLLQSCPTLCDPIDSSPPGSPVSGTLQARALEWVAISFSNA